MGDLSVPTAVASARGPARILRPLAGRDFRLLFSGETISLLGDQFHFVALAWLVLQLTGSGLAVGTVLMVAGIPRAIFILVGGAFADRASPRSVMLISNALRAAFVGVLAILVLSGSAELWQLYVLAAVFGIVDAFFWPALSAMVPMLVVEDRFDVLQHALGLGLDVAGNEVTGGGIERDLPGAEQQVAEAHGVIVWADGCGRFRRFDDGFGWHKLN